MGLIKGSLDPDWQAIPLQRAPIRPIRARRSKDVNTFVARLHHSEAMLLPDGRVLVSGADPQTYYPNGSYSMCILEEFRIEVYIPLYLQPGIPATDDYDYGKGLGIQRTVYN
ncbi:hypothetical protein J3R82DRAFT_7819 [Butyriboletus roseoflavus]|nr:hypothetical protein J3R82DRAFT_7819 [Butyriboletus roseoflavus]